jgi:hypothetical protein
LTSLGESCSISDYIDRPICSQRVEGNPGQSTKGLGIAWLLLKGRSHIRLQGASGPAGYFTLAGLGRPKDRRRRGVLDEEQQLVLKLRKIEALFARPGTEGERRAAENASNRIRARLAELEQVEPAVEFRFSLPDAWSRSLFVAVLRRHGLRPYRYHGQRRTTVMVRVDKSYV